MLQPWVLKTAPPAERFIFERNPFYHRIDENGRQLPYIDRVFVNITSSSLVPAKTGAGESDLQARYLRLDNYTFLKQSEERNGYNVRLWKKNTGSQIALFPNLNSSDEVWRELVRDTRFRRALSLAVNRHEVNQVIYYGLVTESANTVVPGCPLYKPEYQYAWANFDLQSANALLDQIGLTERNEQGLRLMRDGRPLEITLQSAGESTEETDVLELVHDSWLQLGIKLYTRPSQREVFRNRIFSGEAMMSVFFGIDNGMPTADMSPASFVPNSQEQLQWPKWGQYYETNGEVGEEPDIAAAKKLVALNVDWEQAKSTNERERIWHDILSIYSSEVFNIGIVCGVPQPVVVSKHLNNVPVEGIFGWEPTAQFGVYKPDTFWFSDARR
ncbi:MAG: ABC transporter substrate-binding protein [Arenicellales bacterium WSBS_2016_MAG_OTU3]